MITYKLVDIYFSIFFSPKISAVLWIYVYKLFSISWTEEGRVYATGLNDFGQLGIPSEKSHTVVRSSLPFHLVHLLLCFFIVFHSSYAYVFSTSYLTSRVIHSPVKPHCSYLGVLWSSRCFLFLG